MARSTRLTTGILSAPTTEMYTKCRAPAAAAARTRFRALSSSPLLLPAQWTMISAPSTPALDPLARGEVTGHGLDTLPGLVAVPAEHSNLAAGLPQPRDDEAPERARAAGDENEILPLGGRSHGVVHAAVLLAVGDGRS